MGEISITKLLVVAALVVVLVGTKKLRTLGGDLGAAIKGMVMTLNYYTISQLYIIANSNVSRIIYENMFCKQYIFAYIYSTI